MYNKLKLTFALLIFAFLLVSFAQQAAQSDTLRLHLTGKVKSLAKTEYEVRMDSSQTAQLRFTNKEIKEFDLSGNQIKNIRYDKGNVAGTDISTYDSQGNRIEFNAYDAKGKLTRRSDYKYDNQQHIIEQRDYNYNLFGEVTKYVLRQYDLAHRPTKEHNFDYAGGTSSKTTHQYKTPAKTALAKKSKTNNKRDKYDDKGNLLEEEILIYDTIVKTKYLYFYNDQGKKTMQDTYEKDTAGLIKTAITFFDDNGTVTKNIKLPHGRHPEQIIEHKLIYDSTGNWTADSIFENNKLSQIHIREIQYY
jgi:hypothetical protein